MSAFPQDDEHYSDNFTSRTGLELIGCAPQSNPWFLLVNRNGLHPPVDITR